MTTRTRIKAQLFPPLILDTVQERREMIGDSLSDFGGDL